MTGPFSPPNQLYISSADFSSRELTFGWSPVAPDCPAIHYNILASNCGSCPTTTNTTTVTCTDVQGSGPCMFAVQTVVCGNITGNVSNLFSANLYPRETIPTTYTASISSLATALIISVAVSITVIVVILMRSKAKTKATSDLQLTNRAERTTHTESIYTTPLPSVGAVKVKENIAYGHTQIRTAAM